MVIMDYLGGTAANGENLACADKCPFWTPKKYTTQTTAVSEIFCSISLTPKECASLQQILINYHHTLGTVCFLPNAPSSSHTVSTETQH